MSFVNIPLTRAGLPNPTVPGFTVRAMEFGQHVSALVLTVIGVVRAISDGVAWQGAVLAGVTIFVWHAAGTVLPTRVKSRSWAVWWLFGFALLWLLAVSISAEFIWLAFLLWLLAGHLLPLRWGVLFAAAVLAVVILAPIMHHGSTTYANVFGPVIGGIFAFGISCGYLQLLKDAAEREQLVASLQQAQTEMAKLQDELALAGRQSGMLAERTRISRDIHDTVAQSLSSIRLLAHAGADQAPDSTTQKTLGQVAQLAADSLADVRRIVAALAPAELENGALAAALGRMLERTAAETGMAIALEVADTLPQLPTEIEVALLRTAQSALANVRLHAAAERVALTLTAAGDSVRLDIIDDGVGFDPQQLEQSGGQSASFGLRFMRARLRELGGDLEIESTPGAGTAVTIRLPLFAEQQPEQPADEEAE